MEYRVPSLLTSLLVLLALPVPALAQADEAGWMPLGPRAGQPADSVALVPESPGTLLATVSSGIYRATSGGPWVRESEPGGLSTTLNGTGPVFVLSGSSLYRREGESDRTLLRDDLSGYVFAVAPRDPSHLYLATFSPDFEDPDGGFPLRGVEVSRDGGETWTEGAGFELESSNLAVFPDALAVGHQSSEVVYVLLAEESDKGFPAFRRLLRSDDGGATWAVETVLPQEVKTGNAMVVAPDDDATVYLGLLSGLYRSTDGGMTLEELPADGLPRERVGATVRYSFGDLVIDPSDPTTLYAGLHDGAYRSTDAGVTWSRASQGLPPQTEVSQLVFDPADPATLLAATRHGVFRTTDSGASWAPREPRLPTPITAAAIDPARPSRIYAGSGDKRLFVSDDGGGTWSRIGHELPPPTNRFSSGIQDIAIAPTDPSFLLVEGRFRAERQALARSLDRGATFDLVEYPTFGILSEIRIDLRNPNRILVALSDVGGVFESTDRGETWRRLQNGPAYHLLQAPSDPSVLYSQILTAPPMREHRVCRSGDDGKTWSCPPSVFHDEDPLSGLAVDPRDASSLLATQIVRETGPDGPGTGPAVTEVRRSTDGGETWSPPFRPFPEGVRVGDLAIDPRNPETVWAAAAANGVYRSTDGGDTWQPLNRGLGHPRADGLVFGPRGRVLLATTPDGLYRFSSAAGPAPPPELPWITDPALPGFRVKVRIAQGDRPPISGTLEPACIPETVCLSGALRGRSEVFVRIVGPKPNDFLWPTLVKLTTSRVEVWIQQLSTGELRYYVLRGASPGFDELPGLFDREGFLPE